ncbi:MAG: polyhydroxyalkanoic acid system family protein [Bacteroidota bacterium]
MKISTPHQLTQQDALTRVKGLLNKLKLEHGSKIRDLTENWQDNKGEFEFTIQGFHLSGQILVSESTVDIEAPLPLALSFFQGTIKKMIEEKVKDLMG